MVARQQAGVGGIGVPVGDLHAQTGVPLRELGERGRHQGEHDGLERRHPQGAGDLVQRRGQLGLGEFQPVQDRLGVPDEDPGLLGQAHAPPDRLQQRHARLRLQLRELLRDRGRAVGQRAGDRRERAQPLHLAQQPQPVDVEHHDLRDRAVLLTSIAQKGSLDCRVVVIEGGRMSLASPLPA